MKTRLTILIYLLQAIILASCSDDSDYKSGYQKEVMNKTYSCTSGGEKLEKIKKIKATVYLHKDNELIVGKISAYLKDEQGVYYWACGLPDKYRVHNLEIIFSGIIYRPNPNANTYNPLHGRELEITELWTKMPAEY